MSGGPGRDAIGRDPASNESRRMSGGTGRDAIGRDSSSESAARRRSQNSIDGRTRFPQLRECAHFHYDFVELGPIQLSLEEPHDEGGASSPRLPAGVTGGRALLHPHSRHLSDNASLESTDSVGALSSFRRGGAASSSATPRGSGDLTGGGQDRGDVNSELREAEFGSVGGSREMIDSRNICEASGNRDTTADSRNPNRAAGEMGGVREMTDSRSGRSPNEVGGARGMIDSQSNRTPRGEVGVTRVDVGGLKEAPGETFYAVRVTSKERAWLVQRTYASFCALDTQLHRCIYDRRYSLLPELGARCIAAVTSRRRVLASYLSRFSSMACNMINCGPVLTWMEMDNRGHRLVAPDDSAMNVPAIGAAHVVKRHAPQAPDELQLEVGDIVSLISMPPRSESTWWQGKKSFEVGFFPSECVELIGDSLPDAIMTKVPSRPVLRKRGKLITFLRAFFTTRPSRAHLKQTGIVKERVFGCDLGEHLLNSGQQVPVVLMVCAQTIESAGIVDGIYRLSGVASNIQRLRNDFDADRVPEMSEDLLSQDVHSVSSLLKMYFRDLPNPLFTYQLYDKFEAAMADEEQRMRRVYEVVQQLPPPHYRTAAYLLKHLNRVSTFSSKTNMHCRNLAIVWAPNLLRSKVLEQVQCSTAALSGVCMQAIITEFLITYADVMFSDHSTLSAAARQGHRPVSMAAAPPGGGSGGGSAPSARLLSLEEARKRALLASPRQRFIEVGGGPTALPAEYHTVLQRGKKSRSDRKLSLSSWRSIFTRRRSTGGGSVRGGGPPTGSDDFERRSTHSESTSARKKRRSARASMVTAFPLSSAVSMITTPADDAASKRRRLRTFKSVDSLVRPNSAAYGFGANFPRAPHALSDREMDENAPPGVLSDGGNSDDDRIGRGGSQSDAEVKLRRRKEVRSNGEPNDRRLSDRTLERYYAARLSCNLDKYRIPDEKRRRSTNLDFSGSGGNSEEEGVRSMPGRVQGGQGLSDGEVDRYCGEKTRLSGDAETFVNPYADEHREVRPHALSGASISGSSSSSSSRAAADDRATQLAGSQPARLDAARRLQPSGCGVEPFQRAFPVYIKTLSSSPQYSAQRRVRSIDLDLDSDLRGGGGASVDHAPFHLHQSYRSLHHAQHHSSFDHSARDENRAERRRMVATPEASMNRRRFHGDDVSGRRQIGLGGYEGSAGGAGGVLSLKRYQLTPCDVPEVPKRSASLYIDAPMGDAPPNFDEGELPRRFDGYAITGGNCGRMEGGGALRGERLARGEGHRAFESHDYRRALEGGEYRAFEENRTFEGQNLPLGNVGWQEGESVQRGSQGQPLFSNDGARENLGIPRSRAPLNQSVAGSIRGRYSSSSLGRPDNFSPRAVALEGGVDSSNIYRDNGGHTRHSGGERGGGLDDHPPNWDDPKWNALRASFDRRSNNPPASIPFVDTAGARRSFGGPETHSESFQNHSSFRRSMAAGGGNVSNNSNSALARDGMVPQEDMLAVSFSDDSESGSSDPFGYYGSAPAGTGVGGVYEGVEPRGGVFPLASISERGCVFGVNGTAEFRRHRSEIFPSERHVGYSDVNTDEVRFSFDRFIPGGVGEKLGVDPRLFDDGEMSRDDAAPLLGDGGHLESSSETRLLDCFYWSEAGEGAGFRSGSSGGADRNAAASPELFRFDLGDFETTRVDSRLDERRLGELGGRICYDDFPHVGERDLPFPAPESSTEHISDVHRGHDFFDSDVIDNENKSDLRDNDLHGNDLYGNDLHGNDLLDNQIRPPPLCILAEDEDFTEDDPDFEFVRGYDEGSFRPEDISVQPEDESIESLRPKDSLPNMAPLGFETNQDYMAAQMNNDINLSVGLQDFSSCGIDKKKSSMGGVPERHGGDPEPSDRSESESCVRDDSTRFVAQEKACVSKATIGSTEKSALDFQASTSTVASVEGSSKANSYDKISGDLDRDLEKREILTENEEKSKALGESKSGGSESSVLQPGVVGMSLPPGDDASDLEWDFVGDILSSLSGMASVSCEPVLESRIEQAIEPRVEPRIKPRIEPRIKPRIEPGTEARVESQIERKLEPRPELLLDTIPSSALAQNDSDLLRHQLDQGEVLKHEKNDQTTESVPPTSSHSQASEKLDHRHLTNLEPSAPIARPRQFGIGTTDFSVVSAVRVHPQAVPRKRLRDLFLADPLGSYPPGSDPEQQTAIEFAKTFCQSIEIDQSPLELVAKNFPEDALSSTPQPPLLQGGFYPREGFGEIRGSSLEEEFLIGKGNSEISVDFRPEGEVMSYGVEAAGSHDVTDVTESRSQEVMESRSVASSSTPDSFLLIDSDDPDLITPSDATPGGAILQTGKSAPEEAAGLEDMGTVEDFSSPTVSSEEIKKEIQKNTQMSIVEAATIRADDDEMNSLEYKDTQAKDAEATNIQELRNLKQKKIQKPKDSTPENILKPKDTKSENTERKNAESCNAEAKDVDPGTHSSENPHYINLGDDHPHSDLGSKAGARLHLAPMPSLPSSRTTTTKKVTTSGVMNQNLNESAKPIKTTTPANAKSRSSAEPVKMAAKGTVISERTKKFSKITAVDDTVEKILETCRTDSSVLSEVKFNQICMSADDFVCGSKPSAKELEFETTATLTQVSHPSSSEPANDDAGKSHSEADDGESPPSGEARISVAQMSIKEDVPTPRRGPPVARKPSIVKPSAGSATLRSSSLRPADRPCSAMEDMIGPWRGGAYSSLPPNARLARKGAGAQTEGEITSGKRTLTQKQPLCSVDKVSANQRSSSKTSSNDQVTRNEDAAGCSNEISDTAVSLANKTSEGVSEPFSTNQTTSECRLREKPGSNPVNYKSTELVSLCQTVEEVGENANVSLADGNGNDPIDVNNDSLLASPDIGIALAAGSKNVSSLNENTGFSFVDRKHDISLIDVEEHDSSVDSTNAAMPLIPQNNAISLATDDVIDKSLHTITGTSATNETAGISSADQVASNRSLVTHRLDSPKLGIKPKRPVVKPGTSQNVLESSKVVVLKKPSVMDSKLVGGETVNSMDLVARTESSIGNVDCPSQAGISSKTVASATGDISGTAGEDKSAAAAAAAAAAAEPSAAVSACIPTLRSAANRAPQSTTRHAHSTQNISLSPQHRTKPPSSQATAKPSPLSSASTTTPQCTQMDAAAQGAQMDAAAQGVQMDAAAQGTRMDAAAMGAQMDAAPRSTAPSTSRGKVRGLSRMFDAQAQDQGEGGGSGGATGGCAPTTAPPPTARRREGARPADANK